MKYRIICNDDPFEKPLYMKNRASLLFCIQNWFGDSDGYSTPRDFNKERMGIHSAQIKRGGKWIKLK